MKKINLLPEDLREKEKEINLEKTAPKPYSLHIPEAELKEKTQAYKPQVKDMAPKIEQKPQIARILERKAPEAKPLEKKKIPVIKERRVIAEKKKKDESFETKNYFDFLKRKEKKEEPKEKPMALEVNLIPEEFLKLPTDLFKIKIYSILKISFILLFLMLLIYGGLFYYSYYLTKQGEDLDNQVAQIDLEIEKFSGVKDQIIKLQERTESLLTILDKHFYWTKFFELLEKNTINDVYFTDFSAQKSGIVALAGKGKTYESVARQLLAFQSAKDFIKSVEINAATAELDSMNNVVAVNFTSAIELVPDLLLIKDAEISATKETAAPAPECAEFPNMLENCETYTCEFTHILTGEMMTRSIFQNSDGTCGYIEEMPEGGKMECNYSLSMLKDMADFYRNTLNTDVGFSTKVDTETKESITTYVINGIEYESALAKAINDGTCVISGDGETIEEPVNSETSEATEPQIEIPSVQNEPQPEVILPKAPKKG